MHHQNFILFDHQQITCLAIDSLLKELYPSCHVYRMFDIAEILLQPQANPYQMLICDISMPGLFNLNIFKRLKSIRPDLKVLIFTDLDEHIFCLRYMKQGVSGFVLKSEGIKELSCAISMIISGNRYIPPRVTDLLFKQMPILQIRDSYGFHKLSDRELDVAVLLANGLGLLEISNVMGLHISTVSTYKIRIFEKLNINSIPYLVNHLRSVSYQS